MKTSVLLILAASLLTGCGYYFSSLAEFKTYHDNNLFDTGVYVDAELSLTVINEDDAAMICAEENGEAIRGRAHLVPVKTDFLMVLSAIESIDTGGDWTPIDGDLMYFIKHEEEEYIAYDPISLHVDNEMPPYFLTACASERAEGATFSDYYMGLLCLNDDATPSDVFAWASSLNTPGEAFASFTRGPDDRTYRATHCPLPS